MKKYIIRFEQLTPMGIRSRNIYTEEVEARGEKDALRKFKANHKSTYQNWNSNYTITWCEVIS